MNKLEQANLYNAIIDESTSKDCYKMFAHILQDNDNQVLEFICHYIQRQYSNKYKRAIKDLQEWGDFIIKKRLITSIIALSIVVTPNKTISAHESVELVKPKRITLGYETTLKTKKNKQIEQVKYKYILNDEEKEELQKIAYAEARGSGIKGMGLVMQVILNRVKEYGSIHKVIFASKQFESTRNWMYNKSKITKETEKALEQVQKGKYAWLKATYFIESSIYKGSWHQKALKYVCAYKSHVYCTKKWNLQRNC